MTEPLRIAWLVYGSIEQISGGYIFDRLVVEELRALGDSVTVVSTTPGAAPARPSLEDYDVLVADELCFREAAAWFQSAELGAGAKVSTRQPLTRVLLIHHLTAWELAPGPERAAVLALEREAIGAADRAVATSAATARRLEQEGLATGVLVAEPGADRLPRPTAARRASDAPLRLLFVGNVQRRKRVLELVEAFAALGSTGVQLTLVGAEPDAAYASEVREAARATGVLERVRFLGSLTAAEVSEQLGLADALVLPSLLEGYGMVLSEALWCGVPVIASRVGAAEQLVQATGAGLLYEPNDPPGLARALARFQTDAVGRAQLQSAAQRAAERLPRWRDTALSLRQALRSR